MTPFATSVDKAHTVKKPDCMRRLTAASWPLMALAWSGCPTIQTPSSDDLVAGRPLPKAYSAPGSMRLEGKAGDHLLAHDRLVAVVSGAPARAGFRRPLGRLIDVHARRLQGALLQSLVPAVSIDGVPAVLVISSTSADDEGVRARGAVRGRRDLAIDIRYRLGRGDRHVEIDTRVSNTGDSTLTLSGGDTVYLGNVAAFVPGVGDVAKGASLATHWFGHAARGQAFAYSAEAVRAFDLQVHQTVIGDSAFTILIFTGDEVEESG